MAYRQLLGKDSEWALRFQILSAEILVWRGQSKDALALLDTKVPDSGPFADIVVRRKMIQGEAECYLQRFAEAQADLTEAKSLATSTKPELLGDVWLAEGGLAVAQNDYSSAELAFRNALHISQEEKQPFLETKALGSLGRVAMIQERYDEAVDWYQKALELAQSLDAQTLVAKTLGNEGWNYYKLGDLEKAANLFNQAREDSARLGLRQDELVWRTNIGSVEYDERSYAAAESDYRQALALAQKLENKASAAVCLYNLAHVALMEEKYEVAEQYDREALALERANQDRPSELYSLITEGYISTGEKDFRGAERTFREVINDKSADHYLRWQAQAGLADLYAAENQPAQAEEYFRKTLITIESVRSSINREDFRLSFLAGAISFYDDYVSFLAAHHQVDKALQVAEFSRAQTLAEGLGINSSSVNFATSDFNPRHVAGPTNTVLLDYWIGADRSYFWVITPQRVEIFTLPPAAEIDPLVQAYRQALLGARDVLETRNAAGQKLYDLLVAPAAKLIPKGSRVTILPDGSLYSLNFETLLAPAPQLHYWIEDVDVSYANSLTLLAAGAARHASPAKKLLLVGDAVSPDAEFPRLPQAAAEMSRIENYFPAPEREVFAGVAATPESYFDSQPQDFSYIHFVAHGTASRTSPLDSAVILSKQGDNYKLYARDIIQHPLHADLVTISACHGEGVRTYSGEGLVGLSWAFLRAGAHGVIAALWEVNDNSTPQLMDHLYGEISKGVPPAVALRDAKLALLHSGTVYRRPFYWAPFQFYRGA
ncbi:MAG: CHAT domain-containing protein [Candidatus Acidiferrales bacterium]